MIGVSWKDINLERVDTPTLAIRHFQLEETRKKLVDVLSQPIKTRDFTLWLIAEIDNDIDDVVAELNYRYKKANGIK